MNISTDNQAAMDDLIDLWHEQKSANSIYEFLRLTREEYAHWVRTSELPPGYKPPIKNSV